MTFEQAVEDQAPVNGGSDSRQRVNRGAGSLNAPRKAVMLDVHGDLQDDEVFRLFVARQLATQTLSQQRAEWYARSTRLHVMAAFWISVISAVIWLILMVVLVTAGSADDSTSLYLP